jgi:hypothetical protein
MPFALEDLPPYEPLDHEMVLNQVNPISRKVIASKLGAA